MSEGKDEWRNDYPIKNIEAGGDELTKMTKRLNKAKQHEWQRWKSEYVFTLMESQRTDKNSGATPKVGKYC